MNFGLTLTEVLLMFAYAVPGYLLVKSRLVGEKAIPGFAALLMYVLQPCLCIDSFRQITYTPEAFSRMAWFFIICLVLQALSAAAIYAVSRLVMGERFAADTSSRIAVIAGVAGNVGFMGVPLLRALLPDYPEASALSAMFFLAMGLLCWTVGAACITGDVRHMSFKRAFLNPPRDRACRGAPALLYEHAPSREHSGSDRASCRYDDSGVHADSRNALCDISDPGNFFGTCHISDSARKAYSVSACVICGRAFSSVSRGDEGRSCDNGSLPDGECRTQPVRALRSGAENLVADRAFVNGVLHFHDSSCSSRAVKKGKFLRSFS